ncbi:MAG: glycoside hydrolase family 32 protein [Clostridia bacterium]|nr:glycoside hydrolase family 32 protein [Clostridia bacterium]
MVQKSFPVRTGYLHIPVRGADPETFYYTEIWADGVMQTEFLIGIAPPGTAYDHYMPLDVGRYAASEVTLVCREDKAPDDLFDTILPGGTVPEEPLLYPNLYKEPLRQQIHFSPARGWLNDPNGLFYKDGLFHMYFQHSPVANTHSGMNISWGHATTPDGIHFTQHADAITPRSSRLLVASGSAIVDEYNLFGLGPDTVLAVYTDLFALQYHDRPQVTSGGAQNLAISTDGGMTFRPYEGNPIIPVPDGMTWRDPRIFQLDEQTMCLAVYETYEGEDCISFYSSSDCRQWQFRSRILHFYECPDLFKLRVEDGDEELWVVYGASGKYLIGRFENYAFTALTQPEYIDFGDCVYAGQTFSNTPDPTRRIYTAWLRDFGNHGWSPEQSEEGRKAGFCQSMALYSTFRIVKTSLGYRLFRSPIEALTSLRQQAETLSLDRPVSLPTPSETLFTLAEDKDARVTIGNAGFTYCAADRAITTSSDKVCRLCTPGDIAVRILADTRSVEIYIQDEAVMSFFVLPEELTAHSEYPLTAVQYRLKSIWEP